MSAAMCIFPESAGSECVSSHSARAVKVGSIPTFSTTSLHHQSDGPRDGSDEAVFKVLIERIAVADALKSKPSSRRDQFRQSYIRDPKRWVI
jgi:hypothetical protein